MTIRVFACEVDDCARGFTFDPDRPYEVEGRLFVHFRAEHGIGCAEAGHAVAQVFLHTIWPETRGVVPRCTCADCERRRAAETYTRAAEADQGDDEPVPCDDCETTGYNCRAHRGYEACRLGERTFGAVAFYRDGCAACQVLYTTVRKAAP